MRRSSLLRTIATQYPELFQQMAAWKRSGMSIRAIARHIEQTHGITIPQTALTHYLWRYERLVEDTGDFWTPERIRAYPDEFKRSLNAYVYGHMRARYEPQMNARRYTLEVARAMRERVLAQERGERVPPLQLRAVGYRGYDPVPETVLRKLRLERGLTIDQLARRAHVGKYTIIKWERYGVLPNALRAIARLADALGVSVATLLQDYTAYQRIDGTRNPFIESDRDSAFDHSEPVSVSS